MLYFTQGYAHNPPRNYIMRQHRTSTCKFLIAFILLIASNTPTLFHSSPTHAAGNAWPDEWLADSAFYGTWSRADEPVAGGSATRSWLYGPVPFAVANEAYAQSPTGKRLV